jgi:hypothetical protein
MGNDNFRRCYYSSKPAKRPAQMPRAEAPAEAAPAPHIINKRDRTTGEDLGPCTYGGRTLRFASKRAAELKAAEFNAFARERNTHIDYIATPIIED